MKKKNKKRSYKFCCFFILAFVLCVISSLCITTGVKAQNKEKRVLYISSYNENLESVPEQIEGIQSVFEPEEIYFDREYMDMNRFRTKENERLFYSMLKYKLSNLPPYDGIIVGDDAALEFAMKYQEELFLNLPIVFLGINDMNRAELAAKNKYFTGIIEKTDLEENIKIAKKLNPKAKRVMAIVDDTLPGMGNKEQFYSTKDKFKDMEYGHINTSDYSFEELAEELENIKDDTILLYLSMYIDQTGEYYHIKDSVKLIKEHTHVPVYRAEAGGVGEGILGGKMVSYVRSGKIAAKMILDYFNGKPIESIPMVKESPNSFVFDYNIMKKYNIDRKLLPTDAIVINEETNFYQEHKEFVVTSILILGLLLTFSLILFIDNIKRRIVEKDLKESRDQLTIANEELSITEEELRAQYETIEENLEKIQILNHKNEFLAFHDYLTNLPNRMNFMHKLKEEIVLDHKGAILLIDIDNFKRINDTLGHIYGDLVLKEVADRLSAFVSKEVFISRFGGDEFVILLSTDQTTEIIKYIDLILKQFETSFVIKNKENYIQFSIGISRFPKDGKDENQLVMNADTAMYKAKASGKDKYVFYYEEMKEELREKSEIEGILRQAIKEDGFVLRYQPQIDLTTGEIGSFEALLRLRDFDISPDMFIKIAEETGLIVEIGRWVAKEVTKQLVLWRKNGYPLKTVSINYSTRQLRDLEYVTSLYHLLKANQIDPKYIEIEITETSLLEESNQTMEFLESLKKLGFKIALDDFGIGYSSIHYLSYIPANKVKLDKSLCDKFLEMNKKLVLESIIGLTHGLELEITAEGIEEYNQYIRLKEAGCDYIQGYLFSKPITAEEVEKIYSTNFIERIEES